MQIVLSKEIPKDEETLQILTAENQNQRMFDGFKGNLNRKLFD